MNPVNKLRWKYEVLAPVMDAQRRCAGSRRSRPGEALCPELRAGVQGGWALGSPT